MAYLFKGRTTRIGNYGKPAPAQLRLRQAQGILYEATRSDYDPTQIDDASRLIRGVGIQLMHTASALRRVAEREEGERGPSLTTMKTPIRI